MEVKQIYELVNGAVQEVLGTGSVVQEDLSNLVDIGKSIENAIGYDKYVKALVNKVGKTVFVNRPYTGRAPKVLMDGWEYGSICEKISGGLLDAQENESWELQSGTSYDQDIFYQPVVEAKFFNGLKTFECNISFAEKQVKQSFTSAERMNAFISMLYNEVDKTFTVMLDALIMRTIETMIGESVYKDYPLGVYTGVGKTHAINLLALYNRDVAVSGQELTATNCLYSKEFLRFASSQIMLWSNRLTQMSTLFNVGGKERFTPKELQRIVLLDVFVTQSATYLDSDTFHDNLVKLPNADTISYWQGTGEEYEFDEVSKIDIKTPTNHEVEIGGVIGVIFDRDALGVTNLDRRVRSHVNDKAEFYTNYNKADANYFNDYNENAIVFFVASASEGTQQSVGTRKTSK